MSKFTPGPWVVREVAGMGFPGQRGFAIDFNEDQEQVVDFVYEEADAKLISAAPDLLVALENVQREHALLLSMKNCELRRGKESFGVAVMSDDIAKEWQSHKEELDSLIGFRLSAIAKARGEA